MTMVTVKSPATSSRRLASHYLLLSFAAVFLCATILIVNNTSSLSAGVRSHSSQSHHSSQYHLIYGTAWKKDETARLVSEAIKSGFRHIDTACQPKHYNEAGVGDGWSAATQELGWTRKDIWLQTKFTPVDGQDPNNIPYDKNLPIDEQARESLKVSLKNLKTDYLDSWVLHSSPGSFEEIMKVWRVMEEAVDTQQVLKIGISNIYDLETFRLLYQQARRKPSFLQNRFRSETKFDRDLRRFCKDRSIKYQSFWTLTANRKALATPQVQLLAKTKGLTPQTYMYAFLLSLGYVTPLDGTTDKAHMVEDIAMMKRVQGGDLIFTAEEQKQMTKILNAQAASA